MHDERNVVESNCYRICILLQLLYSYPLHLQKQVILLYRKIVQCFSTFKITRNIQPFWFYSFFKCIKTFKQLDLLLIAIEPELKTSGIINLVLGEAIKHAIEDGIEYAETGPELADNAQVQSLWKNFNCIFHKKRVCYVRSIDLD